MLDFHNDFICGFSLTMIQLCVNLHKFKKIRFKNPTSRAFYGSNPPEPKNPATLVGTMAAGKTFI